MKYFLAVLLIAAAVFVYRTPTTRYRAHLPLWGGYQETKLQETVYKVNFNCFASSPSEQKDFALLRAAELATGLGYGSFYVESEDSGFLGSALTVRMGEGPSRNYNAKDLAANIRAAYRFR